MNLILVDEKLNAQLLQYFPCRNFTQYVNVDTPTMNHPDVQEHKETIIIVPGK